MWRAWRRWTARAPWWGTLPTCSSRRRWSLRWTSCAVATASAITPPPISCTPRCASSSGPTSASRAPWSRPSGCGSTSRPMVRWGRARWPQARGARTLRTQPEHLVRRIEQLVDENRKLTKRVEELLRAGAGPGGSREASSGEVERIGDVELHLADSDLEDRDQIGLVMDAFRATHRRAVSVLFTNGDRPGIHVAVTDDLVAQGLKAGDIAAALAAVSGRQGGRRAHLASARLGRAGEPRAGTAPAAAVRQRLLAR